MIFANVSTLPFVWGRYGLQVTILKPASFENWTALEFNTNSVYVLFTWSTIVFILSKSISSVVPPKYLNAFIKHLNKVTCVWSNVNSIYLYLEFPRTIKNILTTYSLPFESCNFNFSFQSTCDW